MDRRYLEDGWLILCLVPYVTDFVLTFALLAQSGDYVRFFTSKWPRAWIIVNFLVALLLFLLVWSRRRRPQNIEELRVEWAKPRSWLAISLCVGFILRLYAASAMHFGDTDEIVYVLHARDLHLGRGFVYPLLQRLWWIVWSILFNPMPAPSALLESHLTPDLASLLFASRCLNVLLSTFSLGLLYLIGRKLFGEPTAILAVVLQSINRFMITGTESHAYSENPGNFFFLLSLVLIVYWLDSGERNRNLASFLSGVALAFSFSCRFVMGIFIPPILAILFLLFRRSYIVRFLLGFLTVAVVEGYLESIPTALPFGGAIWLIYTNIVEGKNVWWGVQPWYAYLQWIYAFVGFAIVFLPYAIRRTRATYILGILILPFLGVFSLVPHKELRFISCLFPLIHLLLAQGLVKAGLRTPAVSLTVTHALAYGILMTLLW